MARAAAGASITRANLDGALTDVQIDAQGRSKAVKAFKEWNVDATGDNIRLWMALNLLVKQEDPKGRVVRGLWDPFSVKIVDKSEVVMKWWMVAKTHMPTLPAEALEPGMVADPLSVGSFPAGNNPDDFWVLSDKVPRHVLPAIVARLKSSNALVRALPVSGAVPAAISDGAKQQPMPTEQSQQLVLPPAPHTPAQSGASSAMHGCVAGPRVLREHVSEPSEDEGAWAEKLATNLKAHLDANRLVAHDALYSECDRHWFDSFGQNVVLMSTQGYPSQQPWPEYVARCMSFTVTNLMDKPCFIELPPFADVMRKVVDCDPPKIDKPSVKFVTKLSTASLVADEGFEFSFLSAHPAIKQRAQDCALFRDYELRRAVKQGERAEKAHEMPPADRCKIIKATLEKKAFRGTSPTFDVWTNNAWQFFAHRQALLSP